MVSRDQRDPIVLQKVRKQGMILARVNTKDSIYKSLIPTFGLLVIIMVCLPYTAGGIINPKIVLSKLPLSSLFRSAIRSRN